MTGERIKGKNRYRCADLRAGLGMLDGVLDLISKRENQRSGFAAR